MISSSVVLLLAVISCVHSYELTQPASLTVRPDGTLTIDCKVSYSVTSSATAWIRQPAGKALEWIGLIGSDGSLYYKDSLKSKFSITRDTSSNTITLQGKNMQAQDTAVYYCARDMGGNYFDYWGKGTKVTVSSDLDAKVIPPVVFPMSSCESLSDSLILGCLASGFSPAESVSFKWMDQSGKALTDFIEHPTVKTGDKMLKVSYINITKEKWDQSKIMCAAEHSLKNVTESFSKVPTLSLVHVPTQKSTSVMCVIEDFYPENISVQWKVNDNNSPSQSKLVRNLNEDTGFYKAYSFYKVSSETWNANTSYTCEVTHQGKPINVTNNFEAKLKLTLKPPNQKKLFVNKTVVLEAVVSGDVKKTVQEASVLCKVISVTHQVTINIENKGVVFSNAFSQFVRIENIVVNTVTWFNGDNVICTIRDNNNKEIKQEIRFDKGDGQKPSVFLYKPNHINTDSTNYVSLVCEVTSPKLGDVYLMWNVSGDKEPYKEGRTSAPIRQNDSTSVLSILTVSKQQYENVKTIIACAVMHANMKNMSAPLQVSTSSKEPPEPEKGFALNCNKDVLEEDEFRSLWSTATSFIFLFLFSLTYSAVLSFFKMKQQ